MSNNNSRLFWVIIIAFLTVPICVSVISTIHVVSFFELSNYYTLSLTLALSFEIGALSALAGLVAMDKINKSVVWFIFILLTLFQMVGNTYYSYDTTSTKMITEPGLIKNFTELFGFSIYDEQDVIFIKRIIAILSGAILPVISLSFLHLLVSYISKSGIKPLKEINEDPIKETMPINEIIANNQQPQIVLQKEEEFLETEVKPDNFNDFLNKKKKKLEEDRINYLELLETLFKSGTAAEHRKWAVRGTPDFDKDIHVAKKGDELPSYTEFIKLVDTKKYSSDTIKVFLTLCNYLDISKVSGTNKVALVNYEEAIKILENYLTLNTKQ